RLGVDVNPVLPLRRVQAIAHVSGLLRRLLRPSFRPGLHPLRSPGRVVRDASPHCPPPDIQKLVPKGISLRTGLIPSHTL
ncbi:hypothetical protein H4S07_005024, partial [Coemansia furcata]